MSYPPQEPPKAPLNLARSAGWGMVAGLVTGLAPGAGERTDWSWAVLVFLNGAFGALFFLAAAVAINKKRR